MKPRWIAALVFALALSWVFVLLSQWQFSTAESEPPPPAADTENVRPLTEVFTPATDLMGKEADRMVTFTGAFDDGRTVLVEERLQDGETGWWVVTPMSVDGAPGGEWIPVVRGWIADPQDAEPAPEGDVTVVGRLLPPEAPEPRQPDGSDTVPTLSPAELTNRWDLPLYAAFVPAHETLDAAGEPVDAGAMEPVVIGPQPQETSINWMNVFYAVEWVIFAGFSVFLWWRLVADDHRRALEDAEDEDDWEDEEEPADGPDRAGSAPRAPGDGTAPGPSPAREP